MTITPECRYGHGRLREVTSHGGRWALSSPAYEPVTFVVKIWACSTCGYIELFDDDPLATTRQQEAQ